MSNRTHDKSLYSLMNDFARQFVYTYEEGLDIDITVLLRRMKEEQLIKEFILSFDRNTGHFKLAVFVENFSLPRVHAYFLRIHNYIAMSPGTIYAYQELDFGRRYLLVSFYSSGKGYYCEIDFIGSAILSQIDCVEIDKGENIANQGHLGVLYQGMANDGIAEGKKRTK